MNTRSEGIGLKHIDPKTDPTLQRIRRENAEVLSGNPKRETKCTREGWLYIITNPAWPDHVKIGRALDYEDRLRSFQTGDPFRAYKLEFSWYFRDRYEAEKDIHRILRPWWEGGEWFRSTVEDAKFAIKSINR